MGWASKYIEELQSGKTVEFRPTGNSMKPHIESGQLVTVEPFYTKKEPQVGDIVLCQVNGSDYLHFIKEVDITKNGKTYHYRIGNARGGYNGWITSDYIYGILRKVKT